MGLVRDHGSDNSAPKMHGTHTRDGCLSKNHSALGVTPLVHLGQKTCPMAVRWSIWGRRHAPVGIFLRRDVCFMGTCPEATVGHTG